ncbi:MAG: cation:proton antiporter [Bacteroidales bacterium]|nr:cation:proton antiporter [Bacteroidales bacterium]
MTEELNLVRDLALILISAGVFTIISKALKQPLILGYIIAGFLVGPHLGLFPTVTSVESVHQWSEIGIIFLLFGLGLEFSFKKLLKVGSAALTTAGTICAGMFIVGIATGSALGWSMMESIFLGGMISMSSSTIVIKIYDELGLKRRPYAGLVFGTLVVEDLIAVLLMVVLSTLAASKHFEGASMLKALARLAFFIILWFLVGIYVIPSLLKRAKKYLSDEILLLVSIGLCFGMVVVASAVGFSSALGAFVMGSILAETIEGERIEHLTHGIKDLFGAVFFVSVGMMLDPAVIGAHWLPILILTVAVMVGLVFFSTTGVIISGKGLDTAVHTGFSLSQIGEFSFIIAGLGVSLGVMRDFIYPIIISVSVITTFVSPYVLKAADPAIALLRRKLPAALLSRIDPPQTGQAPSLHEAPSEWKTLLTSYTLRLVMYGVVIVAVILAGRHFLPLLMDRIAPSWGETPRSLVMLAVTLAALLPFLYGMAIGGAKIRSVAGRLLKANRVNAWPVLALLLLRIFIAVGIIVLVVLEYFHLAGWTLLLIVLAAALLLLLARVSLHRFTGLEERFFSNLNEREDMERKRNPVRTSVNAAMSGYDVHLETVVVPQNFSYIGRTLREMPFRKTSGVNIVKIQRGDHGIIVPSGDEIIYPFDRLVAVGSTAQIEAFTSIMQSSCDDFSQEAPADFAVEAVALSEGSPLVGRRLADTEMRSAGCMVISILRDGHLNTNPRPDFVFETGDTVYLAGLRSAFSKFI